jgi:alpha-D-ribose 1-methylphosphonate 5-triphosphate synthase subunit PhnI
MRCVRAAAAAAENSEKTGPFALGRKPAAFPANRRRRLNQRVCDRAMCLKRSDV